MFGVTPLPTNNLSPLVGSNLTAWLRPIRSTHLYLPRRSPAQRQGPGLRPLFAWRVGPAAAPLLLDGRLPDHFGRPLQPETYVELSHTGMGSWTHTFSPRSCVENVFTVSLINWQYSLNQPSATGRTSPASSARRIRSIQPGAPYINNALYQGVSLNGIVPRSQYTKVFSGEQNYSWIHGGHQLEFGWRYRQDILDTLPDAPEQSILSYASNATALYNPSTGTAFGTQAQTGDNGANFFLGIADSYVQQRRPQNFNMRGKDIAGYVQDNWKIRPQPHR